jgi:integrase
VTHRNARLSRYPPQEAVPGSQDHQRRRRVQSEVLTLQWRQIDFKAGVVQLEPGTTKNLEGRVFVMTPELRAILEAHRGVTEAKQQKTGSIIPRVFHRTKRGRPRKSFRKAWQQACAAAGVPGRILPNFRRTAVSNLERAGIPRSVAMKIVGHKTESVYRRYAIVDEAMLRDAAVKLAAHRGQSPGQSGVVIIEPMSWKDAKKLVGRDGIEPPTPGFSVLCSTN